MRQTRMSPQRRPRTRTSTARRWGRRAAATAAVAGIGIATAVLAPFASSQTPVPATIASRGAAAHTTYTSDSTTTLTVAAPAGAQAGDVLVASLGFGKTGAASQPTLTTPSGWTLVSRTSHSTDGTLAVFTHTFAAGETSYSWTTNVTVGGAIFVAAFGNVNTTTPIDVSGGVPITTASATLATPSLTTTAAGDQLVAGYFAYDGGASGITWTPPAGMTEIGDATNGSSRSGELDTVAQAAAGATGQKTATASAKQDYGVAALTALAPKQTQTIGFTSTAPAPASVGGATYTPAASGGGSGNPVIFTIDPAASGVCAIAAGVVSFTGAGTCVIDANQAGNGAYTAAPQTQQTFTVGGGTTPQTISFSSSAPVGATVGGTYTPVATATSGLGVAVTVDAAASAVCTISGGVVTFTGAGTCVIDANQAGNATYAPAPQAQQSFGVGLTSQAIAFTSSAPAPASIGGATYTPTASGGGSGNPVIFTIDPAASGVCAITAGVVSFTGAGTCVIDANQAGNSAYSPAPQVQQSVAVVIGSTPQTISFVSNAPAGALVGGTYTPVATASSGLGVSITIDPSASTVCSITAGIVHFTGAGTLRRRCRPGRQCDLRGGAPGPAVVCGGAHGADDQLQLLGARRGNRGRDLHPGRHGHLGTRGRRDGRCRSERRCVRSPAASCTSPAPGRASSTPTRPATATYAAALQVQQSFGGHRPDRRWAVRRGVPRCRRTHHLHLGLHDDPDRGGTRRRPGRGRAGGLARVRQDRCRQPADAHRPVRLDACLAHQPQHRRNAGGVHAYLCCRRDQLQLDDQRHRRRGDLRGGLREREHNDPNRCLRWRTDHDRKRHSCHALADDNRGRRSTGGRILCLRRWRLRHHLDAPCWDDGDRGRHQRRAAAPVSSIPLLRRPPVQQARRPRPPRPSRTTASPR